MARLPKYKTTEELAKVIDNYFEVMESTNGKITITGLMLHCGFHSRQSFYDLEKDDKFSYIIKKAQLKVQQHYEELTQRNGTVAGPIFVLKNMGWSDKQEIDHTSKGEKIALNVVVDENKTAEILSKLLDNGSKAD